MAGFEMLRVTEASSEGPGSEDGLANGRALIIMPGKNPHGITEWRYPLDGSNPAMAGLWECLSDRVHAR